METDRERLIQGLAVGAKSFEIQAIPSAELGQNCPKHYPQCANDDGSPFGSLKSGVLGDPLSIRDVARLIGCSAWTVRQRHVPSGLPCFRSGPAGKLIFYRNQVVAWILRQQKGGKQIESL